MKKIFVLLFLFLSFHFTTNAQMAMAMVTLEGNGGAWPNNYTEYKHFFLAFDIDLNYLLNKANNDYSGEIARSGYTLTGWNSEADGTGLTYTNYSEFKLVDGEKYNVYAQWTDNNDHSITFKKHPEPGVTCCVGERVEFNASATGLGMTYQWQKKNGDNWVDIPGADNPVHIIHSVSVTDDGIYRLMIKGTYETEGKVSNEAVLNVPGITSQPIGGECSTILSVSAQDKSDHTTTYQWYKNSIKLEGETNATCNIADPDKGIGDYYVEVTTYCGTDKSNTVSLTVMPVAITQQPVSDVVCTGETHKFTVTAVGTNATYQWQKLDAGNTWNNIMGANTADLEVTNVTVANAGSYRVVVNGTCGTETSQNVTLTVNTPVAITQQPVDNTVCPGETHQFAITAVGTNTTFQWQKLDAGNTWNNIPGANTNKLELTNVTVADEGSYRVMVNGTCGSTQTSSEATLTINTPVVITQQPVSGVISPGETYTFSIVVSGSALDYKWYKKGNSNPVFNGMNFQTSKEGVYYVQVAGCDDIVTSKEVRLTVQYPTPPINRTVSLYTYEGLITDLSPGVTNIASGGNFSFKYYLKEGYTAENIKITTGYERYDDQITIVPEKDGGFLVTIYAIQHTIEINITGVEVSGSVNNEKLADENSPSAWSYGQMLYIRTPENTNITIYDIKGVLYKKEQIPAGLQSYSLSKGIYIVRFNNDPVQKVVIY